MYAISYLVLESTCYSVTILHMNTMPAELSHRHARVHLDRFQANESNDYFPPPSPVTITFKSFNMCPLILALSRRRSGIFMCSTYIYMYLVRLRVNDNSKYIKFDTPLPEAGCVPRSCHSYAYAIVNRHINCRDRDVT